jgi:hypothetical protein
MKTNILNQHSKKLLIFSLIPSQPYGTNKRP